MGNACTCCCFPELEISHDSDDSKPLVAEFTSFVFEVHVNIDSPVLQQAIAHATQLLSSALYLSVFNEQSNKQIEKEQMEYVLARNFKIHPTHDKTVCGSCPREKSHPNFHERLKRQKKAIYIAEDILLGAADCCRMNSTDDEIELFIFVLMVIIVHETSHLLNYVFNGDTFVQMSVGWFDFLCVTPEKKFNGESVSDFGSMIELGLFNYVIRARPTGNHLKVCALTHPSAEMYRQVNLDTNYFTTISANPEIIGAYRRLLLGTAQPLYTSGKKESRFWFLGRCRESRRLFERDFEEHRGLDEDGKGYVA